MKLPPRVQQDKIDFIAGKMKECKSLDEALVISAQWLIGYLGATGTAFKTDDLVQKFAMHMKLIIDRIPNVSEEKSVTIGFPEASK